MATPQLPTQFVTPLGPQPQNPVAIIGNDAAGGNQRQAAVTPEGYLLVAVASTSSAASQNVDILQVNNQDVGLFNARAGSLGVTVAAMGSGLTDLSVVNLGSGSQTFAADANRRYLFVANPQGSGTNIGLKLAPASGASASLGAIGTMPLFPGGAYTAESSYVYTGEFTVCGSSGGGGAVVLVGSAP